MTDQTTEGSGGTGLPSVDGDLGPRPDPHVEPGDPPPGGPDAVTEGSFDAPLVPDLHPDVEPDPAGGPVPETLKEGEDTSTEATSGRDSEAAQEPDEPEEESPV